MYVRLFKGELLCVVLELTAEMIQTVLESESYLFSPQELWVLKHILGLPCEQL
jgi:Fanconi-associated nuclease 1